MNKDSIVQFVCFATNLNIEEFAVVWERYASQPGISSSHMKLQTSVAANKRNKYKYVSQHDCGSESFKFAFLKGNAEHFPEHTAKVILAGGYTPVQLQCSHRADKNDVKILAFISSAESDFDFYHRQTYRHLNIYQAYYENCIYSYIMEFFVQEPEALALISQLNARPGIEAAIYTECTALHVENTPVRKSRSLL